MKRSGKQFDPPNVPKAKAVERAAPWLCALLAVAAVLGFAGRAARGQGFLSHMNHSQDRQYLFQKAGNVPHRGASIPLHVPLVDSHGQTVTLSQYFNNKRPAILMLVYYHCPYLCGTVMNSVANVANHISLLPGSDYNIVTISFDPTDTPAVAAQRKAVYTSVLKPLPRAGAGAWHFLTGTANNVHQIAATLGFRYQYIAVTKQYNHSAGIFIMTPKGKLSQFLSGAVYNPTTVKIALIKAGHGKIGSFLDQAIVYCCAFDPNTGKYTAIVWHIMQFVGIGTLLGLVALIGGLLLWEKRRKRIKTTGAVA